MNRHVLKILCVLTALIIWIQVASSSLLTRDVELPLRLEGLSTEATLAGNEWPDVVQVRATGSKWHFFLNQFLGRSLGRVEIDLSDVAPGVVWQRDVTVNDVASPLTDVSIQPPVRLVLRLDRLVTRRLPVEIVTVGALSEHRILVEDLVAVPDSVDVRGPSELLATLQGGVATEPLDLGRVRGRQVVPRTLVVIDEHLEVSPGEVTLSCEVTEAGTRTYENVPIVPLVDVGQPGAEVFPPVASVVIRGPADALERMPMSAINLTVALTGLLAGTHTLTPEALLPDRHELVGLDPDQVFVVIGGNGARSDEGPP